MKTLKQILLEASTSDTDKDWFKKTAEKYYGKKDKKSEPKTKEKPKSPTKTSSSGAEKLQQAVNKPTPVPTKTPTKTDTKAKEAPKKQPEKLEKPKSTPKPASTPKTSDIPQMPSFEPPKFSQPSQPAKLPQMPSLDMPQQQPQQTQPQQPEEPISVVQKTPTPEDTAIPSLASLAGQATQQQSDLPNIEPQQQNVFGSPEQDQWMTPNQRQAKDQGVANYKPTSKANDSGMPSLASVAQSKPSSSKSLTPQQKQDMLKKYAPDYTPQSQRSGKALPKDRSLSAPEAQSVDTSHTGTQDWNIGKKVFIGIVPHPFTIVGGDRKIWQLIDPWGEDYTFVPSRHPDMNRGLRKGKPGDVRKHG